MSALVVLVTCKDREEGRKIGRELVKEKLAACVNLTDIESVYSWKGNIEEDKECLLIVKTKEKKFEGVKKKVKSMHSYELPEIIGLQVTHGDGEYLDWITDSVSD